MIPGKKISRITGVFDRAITPLVAAALKSAGIDRYTVNAGRSIALFEKKGFLGLSSTTGVTDDPVDMINLVVSAESEPAVVSLMAAGGDLAVPGRGMIYSEETVLYKSHPLCAEIVPADTQQKAEAVPQAELTGICCIVQRGEGNTVARVALDTGTCVPAITFGDGTGVRDKLGLLRITIPAEKEVINFMASSYDAEAVMNMMVDAGRLDQPGKGFIYLYPVRTGIVNTKIAHGMPKHAASVEQIITAIDEIKGGVEWRARSADAAGDGKKGRPCLIGLKSLTFTCNEGRGADLVKVAMDVGAAGATISRQKFHCPPDSEFSKIPHAREACNMIVSEAQIDGIIAAMESEGAFDDKTHGQALVSDVPKACTYLGKK